MNGQKSSLRDSIWFKAWQRECNRGHSIVRLQDDALCFSVTKIKMKKRRKEIKQINKQLNKKNKKHTMWNILCSFSV